NGASIESALWSLLSLVQGPGGPEEGAQPLPSAAFHVPILAILKQHGGSALGGDVIREAEKWLKGQLSAADWQTLPTGGFRWHKRIGFAARDLGERGFLEKLKK